MDRLPRPTLTVTSSEEVIA